MKTTVIAAAVIILTATVADATVVTIPTSLNPGDEYRLAFVTSGVRDAASFDIAVYNTFVSNAANSVPELASLSTTWTAIASILLGVEARDNTNTVPSTVTGGSLGVPIFLLNDTKLVDSNDDLWDSSIEVPFDRTETNSFRGTTLVFTGTNTDGLGSSHSLGSGDVLTGITTATNGEWTGKFFQAKQFFYPFYALSDTLTVIPEPTTITLALAALFLVVGRHRLRPSL